jgi:hypothetical protein
MPGMFPHEGGDHGDSFRHLSEEDRQKVRKAFEKAWNKPEVMAARDQLMKANDQYREALHQAIQEADPEVAKILERGKPDGPPGGRGHSQPMPDATDPNFSQKMVQRLAEDLQAQSEHGDRRDQPFVARIHERLMQAPPVRDALKALEQSEPGHRMEAWKHLREAYQSAARAEIAKLREAQHPEPPPAPKPDSAPPAENAPPK